MRSAWSSDRPSAATAFDPEAGTNGTLERTDDEDVSLTVDAENLTFVLAQDGGDTVEGTLTRLPRDAWWECCYVNGPGHTKFETFAMEPATFVVRPLDVEDGVLRPAGRGRSAPSRSPTSRRSR